MVDIDPQFLPKELGERSIREVKHIAAFHAENSVEYRHVHRADFRVRCSGHVCLKPSRLSQASTCPKASCCH